MDDNVDILIEENYNDLDALNNCLNNTHLLILHLNVRSLNSNFESLEIFIDNLSVKPDVIVCTETWLLPCFAFFNLKDYCVHYNHSNINKSDGVVIYVKKTLQSNTTIDNIGCLKIISTNIKLKGNKIVKSLESTDVMTSTKKFW